MLAKPNSKKSPMLAADNTRATRQFLFHASAAPAERRRESDPENRQKKAQHSGSCSDGKTRGSPDDQRHSPHRGAFSQKQKKRDKDQQQRAKKLREI
jgi:hypothetical protein